MTRNVNRAIKTAIRNMQKMDRLMEDNLSTDPFLVQVNMRKLQRQMRKVNLTIERAKRSIQNMDIYVNNIFTYTK